jgi:hypothetical protein
MSIAKIVKYLSQGKITGFPSGMCCVYAKTHEEFSVFYHDLIFFIFQEKYWDLHLLKHLKM